ncbi:transcriptional regulator [Labilibacter sediminis]|nr:transcriptional regulator [Labilibacter sediminis]
MNYIKHQTNVFALMDQVKSFKSYHISLYLALFRMWNTNRFKNPISISRKETMQLARIGSPNTYVQALKDLHEHRFIRYDPSFDKTKGSLIILYRFDTISCTPSVSKMSPSINIQTILSIEEDENLKSNQKENTDMKSKFTPPPLEHIKIYFQQKGHSETEAERFFNYYESNGWMVGGRSKMKDWKAAARNWMLNIPKFQTSSSKPQKGNNNPHTKPLNQEKPFQGSNYHEPL